MSGTTEQSGATHSMETIDKGKGKAIASETEGETSDEEMVPHSILPWYSFYRGRPIDYLRCILIYLPPPARSRWYGVSFSHHIPTPISRDKQYAIRKESWDPCPKLTKCTEEDEDDELAEIDPSNIISNGRRTRGKQIDFAKAAAEQPAAEDDSDDDEDFVAAEDGDKTDQEMH